MGRRSSVERFELGDPAYRRPLASGDVEGHARHVRHATQEDLDQVEALLAELRKVPELRERKRGYFSRGSRAFLHFHANETGDLYVDIRLDDAFQRMRVTSREEREDFLARVQKALRHTGDVRKG
jgi:hypothetical protein